MTESFTIAFIPFFENISLNAVIPFGGIWTKVFLPNQNNKVAININNPGIPKAIEGLKL